MLTLIPDIRSFFHNKANAAAPPTVPTTVLLSGPVVDHGDEIRVSPGKSPGTFEHAEGQSFILQYKDLEGNVSIRPVSVWSIRHTDSGVPVLVARCHLRNATRYFRIDRIEAITDFDGELIEPTSKFLEDTFGLIWPPSDEERAAADEFQVRWSRLRDLCRDNGGSLLTAVGLADGELVPDEVGAILDFVQQCCARSKFEFGEKEDNRLRLYIRRLRPSEDSIDRAVDRMARSDPAMIVATLSACARVMEADGTIHPAEIKMLDEFSRSMTGLPLQYP